MKFPSVLIALLFIDPSVQTATQTAGDPRQDVIKTAFRFAWKGYRRFAFPQDELRPVTAGAFNSRNHWGASAVDALGTAILMDLPDIVNDIVGFIPSIDFSNPEGDVNVFETTIRYLGGLLSAFDLLTGPRSDMVDDPTKISALLNQAISLANQLKAAFDTPTNIPYNIIDFRSPGPHGQTTNLLATAGSLVLEWTRLSDLSGNREFGQLAQKAEAFLLNPSPAFAEPFPGLVGSTIDIVSGQFQDAFGGWGGGSDSFYEYLIKCYVYDPVRFEFYRDRWVTAAESTMRFLASHPSPRPDMLFVARFNGHDLLLQGEHLTCFDGGNFLLGGTVLGRKDFIDFGTQLVETCRILYNSTLSGVAPESYSWSSPPPLAQTEFFKKNGYWIRNANYLLRPEIIESFYYAHRITGDPKYREWAWEAFVNIDRVARAKVGYSAISDVTQKSGGQQLDFQESFLFAELLKYMFLIFNDQGTVQTSTNLANSSWVFTTEGHPLRTIRP